MDEVSHKHVIAIISTTKVISNHSFFLFCFHLTFSGLLFSLLTFLSDLEKIKSYIDSFRYGAPPHAGGGIGTRMWLWFRHGLLL